MTSENEERRDGKLLLAVVGVVVAGAAGIALLAGLSAQREAEAQRAASVAGAIERRAPTADPVMAEQASFVRPGTTTIEPSLPGSDPVSESVGPRIDQVMAEPIVVDPDADLVAVALEAWRQREFRKAAAYFEAQAGRQPGSAWVEYMLGLSLWKDGRAEEAAAAMQRSIAIDPEDVKPFINLSRVQNDRGEFDAALQAADDALALQAEDPEALFLRARSLHNLGRVDEAVEAVETSLGLDPGNGYAHNLLGLIHIEHGRAEAAAEALEQAAQSEPDVAYIQNNLGMALELSDRKTEALAAYRRAVDLDSDHTRARFNLARLEPQTLESPGAEEAVEETTDPIADLGETDEGEFPTDPDAQR